MNEISNQPMILIDTAKYRIRIHRTTLAAIGQPEFILLIVNPEEKTIGVMPGRMNDPGAHRVKTPSVKAKNCYELYSAGLTRQLRRVCPEWTPGGRYRLEGSLVPGESLVRFAMKDAEFTGIGKVK